VKERHSAVRERARAQRLEHRRRGLEIRFLGFLDHRIDNVCLAPRLDLPVDELQDP
jgi:hypothetical protein